MVTPSIAIAPPFGGSDGSALAAALLVRPAAGIESLLPLQSEPGPIYPRAVEQFEGLVTALRRHGVRTVVLEADATAPTGVIATDLAVVLRSGAVLMRPSDPSRRAEVARIEAALAAAGVPILGRIAAPGLLDGGDVIVGADVVYVGVPYDRASTVGLARPVRGNELGRKQFAAIAQSADLRVVEVAIASDARRLRGVAALIDRATVVLAQGVVDPAAFAGLECIEAPFGEEYGAGVLSLGKRRVIANVRFIKLLGALRRARVAVDALDMWEFGKFGGAPSLLALALKRA